MEQERTIAPGVGVERHEEAVGERGHEEQRAEHHERQLVAAHLRASTPRPMRRTRTTYKYLQIL